MQELRGQLIRITRMVTPLWSEHKELQSLTKPARRILHQGVQSSGVPPVLYRMIVCGEVYNNAEKPILVAPLLL